MNSKEAIAKKEEKLAELLTAAEGHPMMKAIQADKAAAILATRTEAAGKIAALRNEEALTIQRLQGELDTKEAEYAAAKAALEGLADDCRTAALALRSERFTFDSAIRAAEVSLIESADPALDEAIQFLLGRLTWLRSPGRISRNAMKSKTNLIFWTKQTFEESNERAVHDAMRYCQTAIEELGK